MKITRFCYSHEGVFSKLEIGGKKFYFCEDPDLYIPEGTYGIVPDTTGQHRGYELTGVHGRSEIEIHVGNNKNDTVGCLLIGKSLGFVKGHWAVVNSKAAMHEFMTIMQREQPTKVEIGNIFDKEKGIEAGINPEP